MFREWLKWSFLLTDEAKPGLKEEMLGKGFLVKWLLLDFSVQVQRQDSNPGLLSARFFLVLACH